MTNCIHPVVNYILDVMQSDVQEKVTTVNSLSDRINLLERKLEVSCVLIQVLSEDAFAHRM